MTAAKARKTSSIYASFMEETKARLDEIDLRLEVIRSDPTSKTAYFEAEFAYLQTRFVCELVALASLAAHYSYGISKNLLKEWNADTIFGRLENINPHCFPISLSHNRGKDGVLEFAPAPGRRMRRTDLKAVYHQCGVALHRGMIKHALEGKQKTYEPGRVGFWQREFVSLLGEHAVLLPNEHRILLVNLTGGPNDSVAVYEAEADGPFVALFDT